MLKYCQTVEKEQVERKEPMQRAAVGASAVRIPRFEWTFEGELNGVCRVSETEETLRYKESAYFCMRKADV